MRKIFIIIIFFPALAIAQTKLVATEIMRGFDKPVAAEFPPGRNAKFLLGQEDGKIFWVDLINKSSNLAYDVASSTKKIKLVDILFHYEHEKNARIFLAFLEINEDKVDLVVQELTFAEQVSIYKEVLRLRQTDSKLKDFSLAFDNNKNLLIALPDGASDFDPLNQAQDLNLLWGKLIRLNISEAEYIAPLDNPFVMEKMDKKEIYAVGFREPADMIVFDSKIFIADRGANTGQELNLVKSGLNYGWSKFGGTQCLVMQMECSGVKQEKPIFEYFVKQGKKIVISPLNTSDILVHDSVSGATWVVDTINYKAINLTMAESSLRFDRFFVSNSKKIYSLTKEAVYDLSLK